MESKSRCFEWESAGLTRKRGGSCEGDVMVVFLKGMMVGDRKVMTVCDLEGNGGYWVEDSRGYCGGNGDGFRGLCVDVWAGSLCHLIPAAIQCARCHTLTK